MQFLEFLQTTGQQQLPADGQYTPKEVGKKKRKKLAGSVVQRKAATQHAGKQRGVKKKTCTDCGNCFFASFDEHYYQGQWYCSECMDWYDGPGNGFAIIGAAAAAADGGEGDELAKVKRELEEEKEKGKRSQMLLDAVLRQSVQGSVQNHDELELGDRQEREAEEEKPKVGQTEVKKGDPEEVRAQRVAEAETLDWKKRAKKGERARGETTREGGAEERMRGLGGEREEREREKRASAKKPTEQAVQEDECKQAEHKQADDEQGQWACDICTYKNLPEAEACEMCGGQKAGAAGEEKGEVSEGEEGSEYGEMEETKDADQEVDRDADTQQTWQEEEEPWKEKEVEVMRQLWQEEKEEEEEEKEEKAEEERQLESKQNCSRDIDEEQWEGEGQRQAAVDRRGRGACLCGRSSTSQGRSFRPPPPPPPLPPPLPPPIMPLLRPQQQGRKEEEEDPWQEEEEEEEEEDLWQEEEEEEEEEEGRQENEGEAASIKDVLTWCDVMSQSVPGQMTTPQKLLGFDFDLTLTRLHIFRDKKLRVSTPSRERRLHAMPESDDECEDEYKDDDVDQETLEIFGGWGRLRVLRRWLRWLKERHVATVIFSANFKNRIELAMDAVGLLQFFQISGTDDGYHHHYLVGPNGKEVTVALGKECGLQRVLRSDKRDRRRGRIRDNAAAAEGKAAAMRKVLKHYNLQPRDGLFMDDRRDVQVGGLSGLKLAQVAIRTSRCVVRLGSLSSVRSLCVHSQ
jgi:hypothetical protein